MSIKDADVAVIGMSCRFPGADSVARFWDNLCAGRESVRSLSDEQLRAAGVPDADFGADSYVKVAATLDDVERFDPGFFKISPLQAELMDPQIRLLLQCAWETLEDAGYAAKEPQNIGVFAGSGGITSSYFSHFVNVNRQFEKVTASATQLGNDKDFLATYISYKLNLTGPSVTVQTACSTAMVALHQARQSLLNGECDMALAGGVSVRVPHGHGYHAKEGFIFSRSGRMRAFDAGADGVVFGSGLGLVLLKRLEDAIADGDNIYAVVKGSAISNDGRNKLSYAASSARGQIACVRSALRNAGVDAGSIGFLESHGTGTAMGDPEEVKALSAAFKEQTDRKGYCRLGAVKTNVGHLDVASGIVSFIKAALAVRNGVVPPMLHYSKPNPRIRFENTPFYINTSLQPWNESGAPRRAAINSLGMGGTNAFVILEEYAPQPRAEVNGPETPVVIPLSARTQSSLQQYARRLLAHLSSAAAANETIRLDDLAYTLQTGRKAMECRVALVVSTMDELSAALNRYLETGAASDPAMGKEAELAAQWSAGAEVDWRELDAGKQLRRISLPTYVFERERYWIESQEPAVARAVIHPLLHLNTSDLNEQRYTSTFDGEEFFLKDHQVRAAAGAQKVLPGVAYLEMARAAIGQAAPESGGSLELCDIVWVQPLVVSSPQQVSIALVAKDSRIDFEIYGTDERIHCQGQARFGAHAVRPRIDLSQLREQMCQGDHRAEEIYDAFERMGLHYGPAHRTVETIHRGEAQRLARLVLPASQQSSLSDFVLHPGLMDGALQAAAGLLWDCAHIPGRPFVPFALEKLRILAPCPAELFVWARQSGDQLDIDVCDPEGNVCVQMQGLSFRALGKETSGDFLATAVWEPRSITVSEPVAAEWHIILCGLPQVDAGKLGNNCAHLSLSDEQGIAERYRAVALATLEKLQALMWSKPVGDVRLQLVLPSGDDTYIYAGLAGMLKTAQLENPRISAQIVFAPPAIQTDDLGALLLAECGQAQETVIDYRDGMRRTLAWQPIEGEPEARFQVGSVFKDHGVYLITGGTGGLGAIFAREILERAPTATIILTGRATEDELKRIPARAALLESLQAAGNVEYRQMDLSDPSQVERAIQAVHQDYKQLNGVIHSAGTTRDSFILRKTADELREVFEPKVSGTVHLDRATQHLDLDFLVMFSALGAAAGNLGQADYVAANGFMDQFATHRNRLVATGQRRGRTLSIRWPLWQDGGMQLDESGRKMLRERTGTLPLQTQTGLRLFYRSLASGCDQTLAMEGDLRKMQRLLRMDELSREIAAEARTPTMQEQPVAVDDLQQRTEDYLRKEFCALLKLPLETVDAHAPLENYGIDSILALDFTRQLEQTFGSLSKTLFFEYLTLRDLAGYFVKAHAHRLNALFATTQAEQGAKARSVEVQAAESSISSIRFKRAFDVQGTQSATHAEPIAIVGLSGRYPQARNLDELWRNLRDGKDCIVEVPPERWDWREYYSEDRTQRGCHFSKWGGFIEGVDEFDARFFNISAVEAQSIDPQERLFLEHAWMAMEDAGYTRASLQKPVETAGLAGQVGVYAGVMYGEYQLFGAEASLQGQRTAFASNPASIANRVSYVLNLHGPSMVVDTMCSSSLTAIHLACQDLMLGRTSAAIAGGVNVTIHPNKYLMLSAGQFISGDGHCQSFGEGGDGYIPGEGVGVVLLKRLSDAQRDGNHIYGVIRGSALSHGGKTNGYTVPNPLAQADAIRQAFAAARIDARHVSYIEAHGTGTKLGDPIEIAALSKVFAESTTQAQFCAIGSAKSNIGHAEAAAGIAGLTKVLLQLKHRQIVPSLHSSRLNPHIDFAASPFVVSQRLQAWEQPVIDGRRLPRIAGISSFGAGGSNAHLVVEEYVAAPDIEHERGDTLYIVPLSARTSEQLKQKARDLLDFITADATPPSLRSIAYTLQAGREAMDERCALLAASIDQLAGKLRAYLDGGVNLDGVYEGQVKANKDTLSLLTRDADLHATLDKWIADGKLSRLAELWAKGLELDWRKFHARAPRWISLPTYPFARQRHWVEMAARASQAHSTEVIHPLVHRNRSDFSQQSYTSTFDGSEFFLTGAKGSQCLAPAGYLEMARVAVEQAMPAPSSASTIELRQVAWALPGVPVENERVTLALFDLVDDRVKFEIFTGDDTATQTVHCQGEASYSERPAPARLDIAALRQHGDCSVTEVRLPTELTASGGEYVLHPALLTEAWLAAGISAPVDMESVRIVFPPGPAMVACVRQGAGAVDIDLCDEQGNICVEMLGVRAQLAALAVHSPVLEPKRIALDVEHSSAFDRPLPSKPKGSIALAGLGEIGAGTPLARSSLVSLTNGDAVILDSRSEGPSVSVLDHGNGLFEIQIAHPVLSGPLIDELLQALRTVQQQSSLKVLLLSGSDQCFLTGGTSEHQLASARQLYQAIAAFPFPTIASLRAEASGPGMLAAALCDFMVLSESVSYSCAGLVDAASRSLFEQRFGRALAERFMSRTASGRELKESGWTCPIVPRDEVEGCARRLAADLANKLQLALRLLKQHLARHIRDALNGASASDHSSARHADRLLAVERVPVEHASGTVTNSSVIAIPLQSKVIAATAHPEGIVVVRMEDREARNMFSDAFTRGMREVFGHVERDPACKVVVLTGHDNYFSSGGTPETLLAIHQGKVRFTDNTVFHLPLDCKVPVIAAMQGHAIGAGWALGMFADFTLSSAESKYFSPYMGYGFTPGAAATLIFPHKIGYDLARETLLTAREYSGAELRERGLAHPVLPRDQIMSAAMSLAAVIAQRPRAQLIALKEEWARVLRQQLQATFELELAMHERTFVGQADTLARIRGSLGMDRGAASTSTLHAATSSASTSLADVRSIADDLRGMLSHELRMPAQEIVDDEPFVNLGLDSITGVTWIRRINEKYRTSIEAIKVYSYPTLAQLARHVREEAAKLGTHEPLAHAEPERPVVVSPTVLTQTTRSLISWRKPRGAKATTASSVQSVQPIAVIGIAGQFPKARNLEEFWRNIAAGKDCVTEIPKDRWDIDLYYQEGAAAPGKTNSKWMGALDEYDRFDAAFFNISPREARSMDPQQRLFLQACWHGIEDAGYNPKALAGSKCGVFVGCSTGDYHQLSRREQLSGQGFTGAAPSILAARISYFLDLQGPGIALDTACSSSLVAIASACDSLISGGSDLALAGGVNVMAGPAMHIMTAQVGMLSPDGRCYTFDRRANGIATGEGVGVVLLKRLADAQRDRDCIQAVIEGWGVNQDGKTNGITAPNADSQARLQQDVYRKFGIDPASIQLIEAHGTGTALGDPIEIAGLKASFGTYTDKHSYCALGSVKSNIGHCLLAAGVSGFLKLVLALKHRQLPPTVHFQQLNEHIALEGTPFYVSTRLQEWKRNGAEPRRAAINSFGFSGTNAHIVLREPVAHESESAVQSAPTIVPLSARTPEQLEQKARDLLAFIDASMSDGGDLHRLAYTLKVGREAMSERLAFVAGSVEDLSRQLRAYLDRGEGGYRAQVGAHRDSLLALAADADFKHMIDKWIAQQALPKLADWWVKGLALDWSSFYAGARSPRRMRLPTYPFAKERYWIEPTAEQPVIASIASMKEPLEIEPDAVASTVVDEAPQVVSAAPVISLEQLQQQLQVSLAAALFMKPADINVNLSFTELGLDSIVGVEWVGTINRQYGTEITATRIYDYPTVKELASLVRDMLAARQSSTTSLQVKTVAAPASAAIVAIETPVQQTAAVSREELHRELRSSLAAALYLKPTDIDVNRLFTELGLDSIIGVEWVKAINQRFGTSLSAIRIYDYPNIKALAEFLGEEMAKAAPPASRTETRFEAKDGRELYFHSTGRNSDFATGGEISLTYAISPENNVSLREHVVFDEHLLPTDAYVELVYSAYRTHFSSADVAFRNVAIVNPLLGARGRNTYIRVVFRRQDGDLQFFVRSSTSPRFENEKVHVQGFLSTAGTALQPPATRDFAILAEIDGAQIPTNAGTYYAPLRKLQFGESDALGHIQVRPHDFKFLANPFALYGGLCTVINYGAWLVGRAHGASDDHFLPHRIERMAVPGPLDANVYSCRAQVKKLERDVVVLDFQLLDSAGAAVAIVEGISLRRVARKTIQQQVRAVEPVKRSEHGVEEKVAIVGMSGRFPMGESIEAFWNNLRAGRDCVTEVPAGRWDDHPDWYHPDPHHPHTSYSKWGGFLERIDTFDCLFFGISPAEAELIDPQQRIFLEECWKAIENAGYAPGALSHESCGVFVGCSTSDYTRVLAEAGQDTAGAAFMGTSNAILAARISYFLNLKGPALALDTACSSSLVAVHLACESIRSGQTQWALAGGINVLATPLGHILTSQVGMPSRDGRCAAFDATANGIVFSEGCGVLLLKSLSRARADNDTILGVIQASGTNQDGKTNGITAPSANAQEQLLKQVYGKFAVDPRRISYIEAHGTATALGDPIEVNALTSVFKAHGAEQGACALGSVKSNIGHTGFAAGVAGIIKVLLCMKHGKLVPSIHYANPNPHLDFAQSPFFVNTEYRDWPSEGPRLAAVSSFGFSGTNAHVVIEEETRAVAAPLAPASGKVIVPLSARASEQLEQRVRDLLHFVREVRQPLDLVRLSYTLQVGRDAMEKRVAFVVSSADELAAKLDEYVSGKTYSEGVHRAPAQSDSDTLAWFAADEGMRQVIHQWLATGNLSKAAELWVRGGDLDWSKLYSGAQPQRMALPTYPFAKQRCWVEKAARVRHGASALARLHPLVHVNTSDLGQQSYSSTFSGDEFFLTDHRIDGKKMLPAVAYLEMARAAVSGALPADQGPVYIELRHIVFAQPIAVTAQKQVGIAVFEEEDQRIGFEIHSAEGDDEVLHAQGYCELVSEPKPLALDLREIRRQMTQETLPGRVLYPQLERMGLSYGPAFQGITAIHQGTNQLLVELSVPMAARNNGGDYLLHPSLLDSALQGSILFIGDVMQASGRPSVPFALESLRILAPCANEMMAWVRHSASTCAANLLKVDIDLCDLDGRVCVQMHGFSSRPLQSAAAFDEAHYRSIISGVLSHRISAEDAAELG